MTDSISVRADWISAESPSDVYAMMERKDKQKWIRFGKTPGIMRTNALDGFPDPFEHYRDRILRDGPNSLPPAEQVPYLGLVWDTLHDKMILV